jgi:polyisoprenyl-phosphate glycosyltransferase
MNKQHINSPEQHLVEQNKTLSILTCVYNEEACLSHYYQRIVSVLNSIGTRFDTRVIFINNGSSDRSLVEIKNIINLDSRFGVITLTRNFGYQGALVCGISTIESDYYAIVDVDCEDPPEMLVKFAEEIDNGYQIVYGIRSNRDEPHIITWMRGQFYKCNKLIADTEIIIWMAEFSMFSRIVRDHLLKIHTTFPFLRTELAFLGFKRLGLDYRREARVAGKSHYNFFRMAQFAVGGILASTTLPLRMPFYIAPFFLLAFFITTIISRSISTLAQVSVILTFLYLIFSVPFIALYLARTYKDIIARPLYVVDRNETII